MTWSADAEQEYVLFHHEALPVSCPTCTAGRRTPARFLPAAHTQFSVDVPRVRLDGVNGQEEIVRDLSEGASVISSRSRS
jgi:hypothetical protein